MNMRSLLNIILEADRVSIRGRYAADAAEVHTIRSRAQLDRLLALHVELRASLAGDHLDVWDGSVATHHDYETVLGTEGARLMITKRGIEYNADDTTPEQIVQSPIIRRLYSETELSRMRFISNDC